MISDLEKPSTKKEPARAGSIHQNCARACMSLESTIAWLKYEKNLEDSKIKSCNLSKALKKIQGQKSCEATADGLGS